MKTQKPPGGWNTHPTGKRRTMNLLNHFMQIACENKVMTEHLKVTWCIQFRTWECFEFEHRIAAFVPCSALAREELFLNTEKTFGRCHWLQADDVNAFVALHVVVTRRFPRLQRSAVELERQAFVRGVHLLRIFPHDFLERLSLTRHKMGDMLKASSCTMPFWRSLRCVIKNFWVQFLLLKTQNRHHIYCTCINKEFCKHQVASPPSSYVGNRADYCLTRHCRVHEGIGSQSLVICAGKYSGGESQQWGFIGSC